MIIVIQRGKLKAEWFLSHVEQESWLIRTVNGFFGGEGISSVGKERIFDSSVERSIQVCNLWWAAMCVLQSWNLSEWPRRFQMSQYTSTVQVGLILAFLSSALAPYITSGPHDAQQEGLLKNPYEECKCSEMKERWLQCCASQIVRLNTPLHCYLKATIYFWW